MGFDIARGVFPTMITPFTEDHRIDYDAVDALIEYYARCGCAGVFADCQSSEMFYLSEAEKRKLTRHVVDAAKGRMQIVASGHTADDPDEQVRQLADAAEAGAAASVIVLNRTADQDDGESVARRNIERILTALDSGDYGKILRAKGIVNGEGGKWIEFDFVPEEHEVRAGHPDYTGRLCVIGAELQEDKLSQLFGL